MHTWLKSTRNIARSIRYPLTEKTQQKDVRIGGLLCGGGVIDTGDKAGIVKQFNYVLALGGRRYRKELDGEYPIQGIIRTFSFSKNEISPDDPEWIAKALRVVHATMENIAPDCQYIGVAQKDGKSGLVHVHVVQNVLHTSTLKAMSGRETSYDIFRKQTEHFMRMQGIAPDAGKDHSKRSKSAAIKRQQHAKQKEGYSWMEDLESRICAAASVTTAIGDFEYNLQKQGVSVARKTRSGWTFVLAECKEEKCIGKKAAYDRFECDFSMANLNKQFKENYLAEQEKHHERPLPDISEIAVPQEDKQQYSH